MAYKFSPSTLKILKDCERCFWLHFKKGIKRPAGIFPSLPSGMDGLLKKHFDSFMEKGMLPPPLLKLKSIKLFDDAEKLKQWRSNFKGISWTDSKGNVFRGAIDNMLLKGKKLIVLDYKTRGYPVKEDTHELYQDQMDIYNLLFRKNGYKTEDYAYLLFYHPTFIHANGDVDFHAELIKLKVSIKNAEKIFKKAVTILESDKPPKAGEECEYCKWVGECRDI